MKACSYCGRKNEPAAVACFECGTGFPVAPTEESLTKDRFQSAVEPSGFPTPKVAPRITTPIPEIVELDMGFELVDGFSRPNWKAIDRFIKERVKTEDLSAAWEFAAQKWLEQLVQDLGGDSCLYNSAHFFCVSDLDPATAQTLLTYAESVLAVIRTNLRTAAWTGYYGRHVLLIFADQDDYYAYISYFCREGMHPLSGGVFLARGYAHVALPFGDPRSAEHIIVHELVHNLLAHLSLPGWLNEGLAVVIDRTIQRRPFLLDRDLVNQHVQYWTEKEIQSFWAGAAFSVAGDSNELSYSLAEILVTLLSEKGPAFIEFVKHADWRDAGQDAAINFLRTDLGDIVGGFFGPGAWRPQ
jgi:hypothetical protein